MITAEDFNRWMYEHSAFPNNGREIAEAMRAGTILVVTDGSYMAELSTRHVSAAWVSECPTTGIQCHGVLPVPGTEQGVNPYRVELTGLLAVGSLTPRGSLDVVLKKTILIKQFRYVCYGGPQKEPFINKSCIFKAVSIY